MRNENRKEFDFYAYCSPTSGRYFVDKSVYFMGEDFRSVKRYKEYMNAGFNVLLLQHENSYSGEDFETSACKLCMTEAYKAGLDRIIVSDTRLKDLCEEKLLIGKEGKFKTEKEFLEYLEYCIAPYRNQPGFYGVQLFDEPQWWKLKAYGQVVKGLKKICPDIYLQCNLLNTGDPPRLAEKFENRHQALEMYFNNYLDESDDECILYDEYPFRRDYIICGDSVRGYQIATKVCKERNKEFRIVLQSTVCMAEQKYVMRRMIEPDMYWQTNMAMGFGAREYSFFTYFTKPFVTLRSDPKGVTTDGIDGATFITRDGTRTKMYYYTKRIISEMKRFQSVLLKYKFDNSYLFFEEGKTAADYEHTCFALDNEGCPIDVKTSKGVVLVTEQKNGEDSLYMVENISNVKAQLFDDPTPAEMVIDLKGDNRKVVVYKKGKAIAKKPVNGKIKVKLYVGDAIFIEMTK